MLSPSTLYVVFKSIGRTLLDACYIPGLVASAEIAWLYLVQWKTETLRVGVAMVVLMCSLIPDPDQARTAERVGDESNTRR